MPGIRALSSFRSPTALIPSGSFGVFLFPRIQCAYVSITAQTGYSSAVIQRHERRYNTIIRKIIVTTCGTSILTNGADAEERNFLQNNANKRKKDYSPQELEQLVRIIDKRRCVLLDSSTDEQKVRRLSAELNGLIGCYRRGGGSLSDAAKDTHYLIHTDTMQGAEAAELLMEWGNANGITMSPAPIKDLNTGSMAEFRLGVNRLIDWCEAFLWTYRSQDSVHVIFNLVGGFKSLQGYMQTLGMFYADETVYIFETGNELLSIPRLPIDLTSSIRGMIAANLPLIRRLQWKSMPYEECRKIPETMLDIIDAECTLSAWGKIAFNRVKEQLYNRQLLPSPISQISYAGKVDSIAKNMEADRLYMLNQALDRFARFIDTGRRDSLHSCDYRKLSGNPIPPSTHEFNLWSDKDGWRAFCHEEGDIVVIDSLGKGIGH